MNNKVLLSNDLEGMSKKELTKLGEKLSNNVEEPLRALAFTRRLKHIIAVIEKQCEPLFDQELSLHSGKVNLFGTQFTWVEPEKPTLDYEKDVVFLGHSTKAAERKRLLDLAFQFKQKTGKDFVDPETGEVVEPPPVKSYKKSYAKAEF